MSAPPICPTCQTPTVAGVCRPCAFSAALTRVNAGAADSASPTLEPEAPEGYELMRELGAGATATVWLARECKLDRLVALKLIAPSADRRLIERLIREGQAVARLRHPNIVAVHAMSAARRPAYLAMDFVEGGDLRQRLARSLPSPRDAAELVRKLADALAHAHTNAVLHRDIKPSNVLLDGAGEPRLADFGLAAPLEGGGDLTLPGQVAGTAAYLAPELLAGADRASPASDLYSVGALLYECLTGRAPFVGDSSAAIFAQIPAIEPPAPRLLRPEITRDLETICLKCLEKIPSRRYLSATALRDDLGRYLRGEPIFARPVGPVGKTVRWCRRHPSTAAFAGLAAALLLSLAIGGPIVALRLAHAQARAATEAASSRAVNEFLQQELLAQAAPENQPDRELTLRTVLDRAAEKIDGHFKDQPLVEADIRATLADSHYSLGDFAASHKQWQRVRELRRQALGADHAKTLHAGAHLVEALRAEGSYAEAEKLSLEVTQAMQRVLGADHSFTLSARNSLALVYSDAGKYSAAETIYVELLDHYRRLGRMEDRDALTLLNNLGLTYDRLGRLAEAQRCYIDALRLRRRVLGDDHPSTLTTMNNLAFEYLHDGKLADAKALNAEALERNQRVRGSDHPATLLAMRCLALIATDLGDLKTAEETNLQVLAIQRRKLGARHPDALATMSSLAALYRSQDRAAESSELNRQTLELRQEVLGSDHPSTLGSMAQLAESDRDLGRLTEAHATAAASLATCERVHGPNSALTLQAAQIFGSILLLEGRAAEAEPLFRRFLAVESKAPRSRWRFAVAQSQLGQALTMLQRHEEAEAPLLAGYAGLMKTASYMPPARSQEITRAFDRISQLYREWNQPAKAQAWAERRPKLDSPR